MSMIVVEADAGNCDTFVAPLRRKLRGKLDFALIPEPSAMTLAREYRGPLPGQQLEVDFAKGTVAIVEPLHAREHSAARQKIEKRFAIPPAREEIGARFDGATWHYWLTRMIDGKSVRVLSGQLPEKAPAGTPVTAVVFRQQENKADKRVDQLADKVDKLTNGLHSLAAILLATLPEKQRAQALEALNK